MRVVVRIWSSSTFLWHFEEVVHLDRGPLLLLPSTIIYSRPDSLDLAPSFAALEETSIVVRLMLIAFVLRFEIVLHQEREG